MKCGGEMQKSKQQTENPGNMVCNMKEDGEISRESAEKQVVGEGINKHADHFKENGKVWKKHLKQ